MTVIGLVQSNIIRSCSSVNKKEFCKKNKVRKFLTLVLIFSIATVIFLYVLQVNGIAAKGYMIRDLKTQVYELEEQNRALQVSISNLKSIDNLQVQIADFDMVKVENIEYVILSSTNVVAASPLE